jgi:diguanylate cyclase (GGDEF)-like protein
VRFGIATRLSWVLALVSSLIAGLTGLYAYRASHDLLVQSAKDELLTSTGVLARRISNLRQDITRDLLLLAGHPASLAVLQQAATTESDHLATIFKLLMKTNPGYFQIRLISASHYGLERVRVDRDGENLLRVTGDDLQEKGHYAYVSDTLKLPADSTYLSRIVINHERGAHAGLEQPTAQLATPVVDGQGHAMGLIVINIDLNGTFAKLAADLPPEFELFLANKNGDFLIHPDRSQTFGFDRGRRVLLQETFPATRDLVAGHTSQVVLEATQGRYANAPVVAAFIRSTVKVPNDEGALILGLTQPLTNVLERADQLGMTILQIVGGFGLAGILLAVMLARRITRPINTMSAAVKRFSIDRPVIGLPLDRLDELGQLARSFDHMQNQMCHQFAELQSNRLELEHLARHDMLTGLPNRRMFMERLQDAMERAMRNNKPLALMFIDLDDFKDINDRYGHDAGDAVLQEVAKRMQTATRKVDTVARLGGDEFVVLLDNPSGRTQIAAIAQKLQDLMNEPVMFREDALTVGLSIGISQFPQDGDSADKLITQADNAMYLVKTGCHDRHHFASED